MLLTLYFHTLFPGYSSIPFTVLLKPQASDFHHKFKYLIRIADSGISKFTLLTSPSSDSCDDYIVRHFRSGLCLNFLTNIASPRLLIITSFGRFSNFILVSSTAFLPSTHLPTIKRCFPCQLFDNAALSPSPQMSLLLNYSKFCTLFPHL